MILTIIDIDRSSKSVLIFVDEVMVNFTMDAFTVMESERNITVCVTLHSEGTVLARSVSIGVSTTDGSAISKFSRLSREN